MESEKRILIANHLLYSVSLAAFLLTIFPAGWMLRDQGDTILVSLVLGTLVIPPIGYYISGRGFLARRYVLFACGFLYVLGSYWNLFTTPNYPVPRNILLVPTAGATYGISVGAIMTILLVALTGIIPYGDRIDPEKRIAEFSRQRWKSLGFATGLGCAITAAGLVTGLFGFLYLILIGNFIVLGILTVFFLLVHHIPSRDRAVLEANTETPRKNMGESIHLRWKAPALFFYSLLILVLVGLVYIIDGLALASTHYYTQNWVFFVALAAGAGGGFFLGSRLEGSWNQLALGKPDSFKVVRNWTCIFGVQVGLAVLALSGEIYISRFHDSFAAHIVNGASVGLIVVTFGYTCLALRPPRRVRAYVGLMVFFTLFIGIVASSARGVIVLRGDEWGTIKGYLAFGLAGVGIILGLFILILFLGQTRKKNAALGGDEK